LLIEKLKLKNQSISKYLLTVATGVVVLAAKYYRTQRKTPVYHRDLLVIELVVLLLLLELVVLQLVVDVSVLVVVLESVICTIKNKHFRCQSEKK
jgi:low temperature requirement protein LtrA